MGENPIVREIVEFGESHVVPEGMLVGQKFHILPWEIAFLEMAFGFGVHTAILSIARRNGKTGLISILFSAALYGPLVSPNSQLISASRSRDQAALVYKYIKKSATMSGFGDQLTFRDSLKEMECPRTGVTYNAVSADAKIQHGKSPRYLATDELGRVKGPRDELFETLTSGQGSYTDPKHFIISSKAASDTDLFNILLNDALTGNDPTTVAVDYTSDPDASLDDEQAWKDSNPSLVEGVRDIEDMRRLAAKAMRIPSQEAAFRNLNLNQTVDAHASFISKGVWDMGNAPVKDDLFYSQPVYGGLDLSAQRDVTSMVLAAEDPKDRLIHVKCFCWVPQDNLKEKAKTEKVPYDLWEKQGYLSTIPGSAIHYEHLAPQIAEILSEMDIRELKFDRWRIKNLTYEFDKIEIYLPLLAFGQGFRDMGPALDEVENLLIDGRVVHGGNPVLTNHVANTVIQMDPTGARKPNKAKSINKIDVAVAMFMAIAAIRNTAGEQESSGLYGMEMSDKEFLKRVIL